LPSSSEIDILVFERNGYMAPPTAMVGVIKLKGIPPAPRGIRQVKVTISVDTNGIVDAWAKELTTTIYGAIDKTIDETEKTALITRISDRSNASSSLCIYYKEGMNENVHVRGVSQ
jgi:molecular chaperone DnaK